MITFLGKTQGRPDLPRSEILQSERVVGKIKTEIQKGISDTCLWPILADMSRVVQLAASPSSPIAKPPIPDGIRPKACKQRRRRTADLENMTLCLELTIKQYKHFCWLQTADLWLQPAVSMLTHSKQASYARNQTKRRIFHFIYSIFGSFF